MGSSDPLSATFAALADPTRRAILARLSSGETTVKVRAEPFPMSLPAVSGTCGCWRARAWRPSGGPTGWRRSPSERPPTGSPSIGSSGRRASAAWRMTFATNLDRLSAEATR